MRRFTFARGNAHKVLALPIYALGALASMIVPRRRNLWVFGSGIGVGEGALALALRVRDQDPSIRVVWMARNQRDIDDARAVGLTSALVGSWRGFRLTLRARVVVVTHGFGDVNRFATRGAFVVQLWHGIPLKRIQLDSPVTTHVPLLGRFAFVRSRVRRAYTRLYRGIDFVPAASPLAAARLRTAFALPADRVAVTGDPRDDVVVAGEDPRAAAREILEVAAPVTAGRRVVLYAPTWRDGGVDSAVPAASDWAAIDRWLEASDSVLLIRSHHLGVGDYAAGVGSSPRIELLGGDRVADVTPVLAAIDLLVTDFSSIAYDFALTGGAIAFLAPDVAAYGRSRGLYEDYTLFSGASEVTSWRALVDLLERADDDPAVMGALRHNTEELAKRNHSFTDGRNTQRVYDEIVRRLADSPADAVAPVVTSSAYSPGGLVIDTVEVELTGPDSPGEQIPRLTFRGRVPTNDSDRPVRVGLVGTRRTQWTAITRDGEGWRGSLPLLTSQWKGPVLPMPAGRYTVRFQNSAGATLPQASASVPPAQAFVDGLFGISVEHDGSGLNAAVTLPLTTRESGASAQAVLERTYRHAKPEPLNAVFFESYYGRNASCNPRALDRALARLRPDIARYWSVADASVEVPEGSTALIEGSEDWWRIRGAARLLVVNDWLRKRFARRPFQTVLQTWHGTPLKRIALSRPRVGPRTRVATWLEKSRWSIMLAQNDHSREIFRSAYAFRGPIWQEGYPRDDSLAPSSLRSSAASAVRERIGIGAGARVVLYAPTWRDDRPDRVDHLDVGEFARGLGDDWVVLIRGHSRTLEPGADVAARGVIDVTSYPDISDLFLVADALVTDYSSVMFDYSVTGKPIYFFTPDLEHYRDTLRGFYFDLMPVAPGPVVSDPDELIELVKHPDPRPFATAYARWQARFNPLDDGGAAERVIRRLIAEGRIG